MKSYEKCVRLLSYGPCVALIGSLLIGSPQGLAQNAESSPSEPLRLTVAPPQVFADRDEDSAQSNLRAARGRRQ
jgi:hypothetical protein